MYNNSGLNRGQPEAVACWGNSSSYPSALREATTQTRWVLLLDLLRVKVGGGSVISRENPTLQPPAPRAYTPNQEDRFVVGFDGESVAARLNRLVEGLGFLSLRLYYPRPRVE